MRYANRQEIADKAQWEGGIQEFILDYGLSLKHLPEGDKELEKAWYRLEETKEDFEVALLAFENLLPESDEY